MVSGSLVPTLTLRVIGLRHFGGGGVAGEAYAERWGASGVLQGDTRLLRGQRALLRALRVPAQGGADGRLLCRQQDPPVTLVARAACSLAALCCVRFRVAESVFGV